MKQGIFNIIRRSLFYYKKPVFYLVIIIALLSAIITGSLFTGYSVRKSLKESSAEKLGNTGFLISSGTRYFNTKLSKRITDLCRERTVSVLEINGYCQNFATGVTALNTKIYGIDHDFFSFHGDDSVHIEAGTVAINERLANRLGINSGDEIILRFRELSSIPLSLLFAPSKESNSSRVLRVGKILKPETTGNFSLGISQIVPMNVFINLSDLIGDDGRSVKANRLLIEKSRNLTQSAIYEILKESLTSEDIGLTLRRSKKTGDIELISDRIFIDQEQVDMIKNAIPSASPLITYLANSITKGDKSTPYSFISALPSSLCTAIAKEDDIIINNWLARDLEASVNDTLMLKWFASGSSGKLEEKGKRFIISRIVEIDSIWSDPFLMPDFPGISESKTCLDWDAGVPIDMHLIRSKDEDYWNRYRGTPKAFISYEKGKELWGNNFGPSTAIRFPGILSEQDVNNKLKGSFLPDKSGFTITNPRTEAVKAASESVDFSTLFLSLGIFMIVSCIILLSLAVTSFFDSRKGEISTLFALGFTNRWIGRLLFLETLIIVLIGTIPGVFAGLLINKIIIHALNSVWSGAVQTDTMTGYFSAIPLISGFLITVIISLILLIFKTIRFLRSLDQIETGIYARHSQKRNLYFFLLSFLIALVLLILSFYKTGNSVLLAFAGGSAIFISLILLSRQIIISRYPGIENDSGNPILLSRLYYAFNPSHAFTPIIIIAAGIFAVFITGANRMEIREKMLLPSGGTGGYLLWGESAIPIKEDLNTSAGRNEFGLDDEQLKGITFVQTKLHSGDDASCLNLNHISSPPLLGLDPAQFVKKGSFSFTTRMQEVAKTSPWQLINKPPAGNNIYGIADQTVLQWGLKIKPGDTLTLKAENGQPLNIIIAAGLKSSVFQGFVLINEDNFDKFFPSVSGYSIFLADGKRELSGIYKNILSDRFSNYGISIESTAGRLASFFKVTNTYLSVFTILGSFGILIGVIGLSFILLRNYEQRKREFALLLATGYSIKRIKRIIFSEQLFILFTGLLTGMISAVLATLPSVRNGADVPWVFILVVLISIIVAGSATLLIAVNSITSESIISALRKE
jgi:putative ABC transport system permease protein